jgi:glyoxylate/hydroxypyruvate reductase A
VSEEDKMVKKKVLVFHSQYADLYRELLEKGMPETELFVCRDPEEVERWGPDVEIAFVPRNFPQGLFKKMPRLKWVQVMAAGVENFIENAEQFRNIPVCRIVGAFGKYMVEYVLAYILYQSQDIRRVLKAQGEKKWDPFLVEFIHRKTIGIMGLGTIGSFVAEKAKGMGLRVITWDMVHREIPAVEHQYKADQMKEFLGEADYVLLTLPATPQTTNLIDQSVFKAMKKTAYLINICRGAVVDEPALVEALKGKEIAGAILDVVKEEPLPPQSELWDCPNLILSPHISGPSLPEDIVEVFKENFRRYVNKEPLIGQIHFERGF